MQGDPVTIGAVAVGCERVPTSQETKGTRFESADLEFAAAHVDALARQALAEHEA
jgi:hypothetical protein